MELSARIGDGFAWYHPDFGTHHEVAGKCFLKPGASLADDAPVDIPRVIATDEYHIAKVSGFEEAAFNVRRRTVRLESKGRNTP
jgi:hypothetical protein